MTTIAHRNDNQHSMHCCWRATIICELNEYIVTNNIIALLYFYTTITLSFIYGYARHNTDDRETCNCFASHSCGHWMQQSGKYLPRVTPADTMVINFRVRNWVVALWNCSWIGECKEASDLAWKLPRELLKSRPPWSVGVCLLSNLPCKNMLPTTQQRLSMRRDLTGSHGTMVATMVGWARFS